MENTANDTIFFLSLAKLPEESKLLTMDNDLQGTLDTQLVLKQSSIVKTDYIGWPIPTNKPLRSSGDTVDARGVLMVKYPPC